MWVTSCSWMDEKGKKTNTCLLSVQYLLRTLSYILETSNTSSMLNWWKLWVKYNRSINPGYEVFSNFFEVVLLKYYAVKVVRENFVSVFFQILRYWGSLRQFALDISLFTPIFWMNAIQLWFYKTWVWSC